MNYYKKQAEDFLKKAKATITITKAENQIAPLWAKEGENYGYMYNIVIERENKKTWTFNYWDSISNKNNLEAFQELRKNGYQERWIDKKYYNQIDIKKIIKEATAGEFNPSAYDILACITKYDPGSFEDFCSDFGYDEDSRTAEKTFLAVNKEWHEVNKMFGDLLEDLQLIN